MNLLAILTVVTNDVALDPSKTPFPNTKEEFWVWAISLVTPAIVWLFGKIPQLPRPILPMLTPAIGIALGLGLRQLANLHLNWVDMAQAGTVAVFIRETVNQLVTKQMKPLEESKTNTKPVDGAVTVKEIK